MFANLDPLTLRLLLDRHSDTLGQTHVGVVYLNCSMGISRPSFRPGLDTVQLWGPSVSNRYGNNLIILTCKRHLTNSQRKRHKEAPTSEQE